MELTQTTFSNVLLGEDGHVWWWNLSERQEHRVAAAADIHVDIADGTGELQLSGLTPERWTEYQTLVQQGARPRLRLVFTILDSVVGDSCTEGQAYIVLDEHSLAYDHARVLAEPVTFRWISGEFRRYD